MAEKASLHRDDRRFYAIPDAGRKRTVASQKDTRAVASANHEIKPPVDKVEVGQRSPLLAIALGPTQILRSSLSLSWPGILLEDHISSPGERISASIDRDIISMFHSSPAHFEHRSVSGEFIPVLARPGMIMITPLGPVPDIRLHTSTECTHCAFDDRFVRSVINELDHAVCRPIFRAGIQDHSIQRIMGLLIEELYAARPLGRLYVESLVHALVTRYVLLDAGRPARMKVRVTGLLPRILRRVNEKIEANLDADLSLESLAGETGYSRAHFLRMFRVATGLTPHQYVLDLRLRRAQESLKQSGSRIIDVAASCGFSSQSHMTSVFRRRLEVTPGEFRRNASIAKTSMLSYANAH